MCLQLERYCVKFNSIKKYLLLIKQKQKNSKIPKRNHFQKPEAAKVHVLTYFQNFRYLSNSGIMLE